LMERFYGEERFYQARPAWADDAELRRDFA
jgi:hypothetical protein